MEKLEDLAELKYKGGKINKKVTLLLSNIDVNINLAAMSPSENYRIFGLMYYILPDEDTPIDDIRNIEYSVEKEENNDITVTITSKEGEDFGGHLQLDLYPGRVTDLNIILFNCGISFNSDSYGLYEFSMAFNNCHDFYMQDLIFLNGCLPSKNMYFVKDDKKVVVNFKPIKYSKMLVQSSDAEIKQLQIRNNASPLNIKIGKVAIFHTYK